MRSPEKYLVRWGLVQLSTSGMCLCCSSSPTHPPPKLCHCEAKECFSQTCSFHSEGCRVSPHFPLRLKRGYSQLENRAAKFLVTCVWGVCFFLHKIKVHICCPDVILIITIVMEIIVTSGLIDAQEVYVAIKLNAAAILYLANSHSNIYIYFFYENGFEGPSEKLHRCSGLMKNAVYPREWDKMSKLLQRLIK